VVECGVWKGGNIILARKLSPERTCWLYDTFDGMTEPTELDISRKGVLALKSYRKKERRGDKWCAASVDEVRANLQEMGVLDEDRLRFVVGKVEDTLRVEANLPEQIALLRLDTDWYASTKVELEVLYPRLSPGGYLIVDDYGHWAGARKAVDEYFGRNGPKLKRIDYSAVKLVKPLQ
jgi:O-methyltransferase